MRNANVREQTRYSQQLGTTGRHHRRGNCATIAEDPDTAPELTDEWFDSAEIRDGDRLIRPAPPPLDTSKKLVSLRLDQDVIDAFGAAGPGWQSRINAALRRHLWGENERA